MSKHGLVSNYTVAQYKPVKSETNEAVVKNELQREFDQDEPYAVVVSDLTYVRVAGKWHYVCLFVDIFNREIIGCSSFQSRYVYQKQICSKIKQICFDSLWIYFKSEYTYHHYH